MDLSVWDLAAVTSKSATYAAALVAAGGFAFLFRARDRLCPADQARARRWLSACTVVALIASVLRVALLAGSMGESLASMFDTSLTGMVLDAGEGRATGLRIVGLALIAAGLALNRRGNALGIAGAIIAAVSFAFIGHAWGASPRMGGVVLLCMHLLGIAYWLGALVILWIAADDDDVLRFAALVHGFGTDATFVVATLALAGALLLLATLASLSDLWQTEYGRLALLKLGTVTVLMGVAAYNKLRLTPRLRAGDTTARSSLQRTVQIELMLAATILMLTASLTTLVGPTTPG